MSLDVQTLAIVGSLVGLELTLGFVILGWMLRGQPGLWPWVLSAVLTTSSGVIYTSLLGVVPDAPLLSVHNGLLYWAFALGWLGAQQFCGKRGPQWPAWAGLVGVLVWTLWFSAIDPSMRARMIGFSVVALFWSLATAWTFFRYGPRTLRASIRMAGVVFILHGLFHIGRLVLLYDVHPNPHVLVPGWPRSGMALLMITLNIVTMLSLVSLLSHRLMVELRRAGSMDVLTGVLNRRALEVEGASAIEMSRSLGLPCSVLLFDLDHFKRVNDKHGHAAGDLALEHFAALISGELRASDVFGRYGGEEFVAVMPGAGVEEARGAAERLRALVASSPPSFHGDALHITVSIGVAWDEGSDLDLERLLSQADGALYQAKDGGRDRVLEARAG